MCQSVRPQPDRSLRASYMKCRSTARHSETWSLFLAISLINTVITDMSLDFSESWWPNL